MVAGSHPWLKVFGVVDLSGVKGKAKSGVKVGTKRVYIKMIKRCSYLFIGGGI